MTGRPLRVVKLTVDARLIISPLSGRKKSATIRFTIF